MQEAQNDWSNVVHSAKLNRWKISWNWHERQTLREFWWLPERLAFSDKQIVGLLNQKVRKIVDTTIYDRIALV